MRALYAALALALAAACSAVPNLADPASDAPETQAVAVSGFKDARSYAEALKVWQRPEDVNAWIQARFHYDLARAVQLSETQRRKNGRMAIHAPEALFADPSGVCVDLSRFAVETLLAIDPGTRPQYVMIEFDPVSIAGNTLHRHWVVSFERGGERYVFADSKRPGHIAGPYASTQAFIAEYVAYRGTRIVSFRETDTYERKLRTLAAKRSREDAR